MAGSEKRLVRKSQNACLLRAGIEHRARRNFKKRVHFHRPRVRTGSRSPKILEICWGFGESKSRILKKNKANPEG